MIEYQLADNTSVAADTSEASDTSEAADTSEMLDERMVEVEHIDCWQELGFEYLQVKSHLVFVKSDH